MSPMLTTTAERSWSGAVSRIKCKLPVQEPLRYRGNPCYGQKEICKHAEEVIDGREGPGRNVPVRFFQMDLVRFTAHGEPVGCNLY